MGRLSTGTLALSLAVALCAPAGAQQEPLGRIERILSLDGGARRTIRGATPLVQLQPTGAAQWTDVAPDSPVFGGTTVRVERYLDARLLIDSGIHRGYVALLPELWEKREGRVLRVRGEETRVREGRYRVTTSGEGTAGLTLSIERGAVAIDWRSGELSVVAAGTGILVYGTQLAVVVDSTGGAGRLFVASGRVTLPQFPNFVVTPGRWIQLRPFPLPPLEEAVPAPEARQAREVVEYHAEDAWESGLLRPRNAFLALGGLVVGAVLIDRLFGSDDEYHPPLSGRVTGRFPF